MKKIFSLLTIFFLVNNAFSQVIVIPMIIPENNLNIIPEHGFLPGKEFPYYSTINKFDFNNLKVKIELKDVRDSINIKNTNCSSVELKNKSEFNSPQTIYKIEEYINKIFTESNIEIDSTSQNLIKISLEAIDSRLIGFGNIKVHGICQMKIVKGNLEKTYCVDIVDGDKNAPLRRDSFATRKTASRLMTSASIREVLEQFLFDLQNQ